MATCVPKGVYQVRPGYAAARNALSYYGRSLGVQHMLRTIVLVELEIHGCTERLDLTSWHQPRGTDVPYNELYYSLSAGASEEVFRDQPASPDFAMSFFLHNFSEKEPLVTQFGELRLPLPVVERPLHLVSRKYSFWN